MSFIPSFLLCSFDEMRRIREEKKISLIIVGCMDVPDLMCGAIMQLH